MGIFKPVTLTWKGVDYEVGADSVMMLIAKIEDIITLTELLNPKGRPIAKISMAYAEALRYAGARVKDDEVYAAMFKEGASDAATNAVNGLLMMMVPPPELVEDKPVKKAKPQKAARSS